MKIKLQGVIRRDTIVDKIYKIADSIQNSLGTEHSMAEKIYNVFINPISMTAHYPKFKKKKICVV